MTNKTVTEIQFRQPKVHFNKELVAYLDVVLYGSLKLRDIQLCKNQDGQYYLTFPSRRVAENQYYNVFHPIDGTFRDSLTELAIKTFKRVGFGHAVLR
jgi:DNA-binding cell septation regulator SpoVG